MRTRLRRLAIGAAALIMAGSLGSCGLGGADKYATVVEFRDAVTATGFSCHDWQDITDTGDRDATSRWSGIGLCNRPDGTADMLRIYPDQDKWKAEIKEWTYPTTDTEDAPSIVYGGNWMIMVHDKEQARQLAKDLSGEVSIPGEEK